MRTISKFLATLVMGSLAFIAASPLAASFAQDVGAPVTLALVFGIIGLLAIFSPTGRRAWGRGSLVVGALMLMLPVWTTVLSAKVGSEMVTAAASNEAGVAAVGATIGGGLLVGASAFFGFIFGAVFLVCGLVLVLGGRREVIVVERRVS